MARNRIDKKTTEGKKIYETLSDIAVSGSYAIYILGDTRKQTQKREAILEVKFSEVLIRKPDNKKDDRPDVIKVWFVEAK